MTNLRGSTNSSGEDWIDLNITTSYIRSLPGKLRHEELISYFSAFGDVNDVQIRNKTKRSYGFIKFALVASAAKALAIDFHIIAGRKVKVAVASDRHQDKTTLLDLNDDCISEILSMKCLGINDLCSVAETCSRLKEIASQAFGRKHKTYRIEMWTDSHIKISKRVLINFGSVISDVQMSDEREFRGKGARKIFDSLTKCCSNTLEYLDLCCIEITESFATKLRPIFNNLLKLTINYCIFNGASKKLFADCRSLVELVIMITDDASFILEHTFPQLQTFECGGVNDLDLFKSFILRHTNLKSLSTWTTQNLSSIFQLIADFKRLEELKCSLSGRDTLDLSRFEHLRKLYIGCNYRDVTKTALGWNNLQFLEVLDLVSSNVDTDFIRTLSQLKKLQVLKLEYCSGIENLNQIGDLNQLSTLEISNFFGKNLDALDIVLVIKRLSKLKYLTVTQREFKMDLEKYLRIVDIVRRKPDSSKLTFRLRIDRDSFNYSRNYESLRHDFSLNAHIVEMIMITERQQ